MNKNHLLSSIFLGLTMVSTISCANTTKTVAGCEVMTTQAEMDKLLNNSPGFMNPPVYDFIQQPATIADMKVQYMETTLAGCPTKLRNYGGEKYDGRPVGPTMLISPGQQYLGLINNQLPPFVDKDGKVVRMQSHGGESTKDGYVHPDGPQAMQHNIKLVKNAAPENAINPAKFNVTNLHTHGWHVWPTENHDNIFAEVHPGDAPYLQQVTLPSDHVAGTFWYHAHLHGSTALQVASGMAGALIVKDTKHGLGTIDFIDDAQDSVFVLQQLAYGEDGKVESYNNLAQSNLAGTTPKSGLNNINRPTFVNGQVYPTLTTAPNRINRWRFIHAGITNPIRPMLVKDYKSTDNPKAMTEIALDGLPTGSGVDIDYVDLSPGYRVDVLVQFDKPGTYYLIDQHASVTGTVRDQKNVPTLRRVLAKIEITGNAVENKMPGKDELNKLLAKATSDYTGGDYKPMHNDPFEDMGPLANITDDQLTGKTQIVHFMASSQYRCPKNGGSCRPCLDSSGAIQDCKDNGKTIPQSYMVCDGKSPDGTWMCFNFNPASDYARTLALDTASEWFVSGDFKGVSKNGQSNHTFHIHVNPFQVQRKFVNPVYAAGGAKEALGDQWVWKDTLRTPVIQEPNNPAIEYDGQARLKSRYTNFTGAFVQHCHVLHHEDQGMMQVVEVVPGLNDLADNPADSQQAGNHVAHH